MISTPNHRDNEIVKVFFVSVTYNVIIMYCELELKEKKIWFYELTTRVKGRKFHLKNLLLELWGMYLFLWTNLKNYEKKNLTS